MRVRIVVVRAGGRMSGQSPGGLVMLVRCMRVIEVLVTGQQVHAVRVHHLALVNDRDGILRNKAGERQQGAGYSPQAKAT